MLPKLTPYRKFVSSSFFSPLLSCRMRFVRAAYPDRGARSYGKKCADWITGTCRQIDHLQNPSEFAFVALGSGETTQSKSAAQPNPNGRGLTWPCIFCMVCFHCSSAWENAPSIGQKQFMYALARVSTLNRHSHRNHRNDQNHSAQANAKRATRSQARPRSFSIVYGPKNWPRHWVLCSMPSRPVSVLHGGFLQHVGADAPRAAFGNTRPDFAAGRRVLSSELRRVSSSFGQSNHHWLVEGSLQWFQGLIRGRVCRPSRCLDCPHLARPLANVIDLLLVQQRQHMSRDPGRRRWEGHRRRSHPKGKALG